MMHYRENFMKQWVLLEYVLDLPLKVEEVIKIEEGWNAFYMNPVFYKDSIVVDMVLKDIGKLLEIEE